MDTSLAKNHDGLRLAAFPSGECLDGMSGAYTRRTIPSGCRRIPRRSFCARSLAIAATVVLLFGHPCLASPFLPQVVEQLAKRAISPLLEVFQVYPPVLTVTPGGVLEITDGSSNGTVDVIDPQRPSCQQLLVNHSFAASYGHPFVGEYTPPPCVFNRVSWNLTVTSAGKQFDRLGIVYLGDNEVLRTSTAEPTISGIQWTYLKDMTHLLSLFKQDQRLIFDLGNLIDDVYTAAFNVTLTASYFEGEDSITPADLILPISSQSSSQNQPSVFTVPPETASSALTLPRNTRRAVLSVAATGQSQEEFWWSNVLQSQTDTFPQYGPLYGYSPFREVQVFIDGSLASVVWPFPVIFTGGVVPGLWRPIVGIDAFDLREDEINITPWLPLLCDGNPHNFTIKVSGLNDTDGTATLSETTDNYWLVTGKVFVWLDQAGHITTGSGPHTIIPTPAFQISSIIGTTTNGTNDTLQYSVTAQRSLSFESTIYLSHGSEHASWRQTLSFSNNGSFSDGGNAQINTQQTTGYDISSSGYARHISYPLYADSIYVALQDNISYTATVNRGKDTQTVGKAVFPTGLESFAATKQLHGHGFQGTSLTTVQNGNATYLQNTTTSASFSFGTTQQDMVFSGIETGIGASDMGFPAISGTRELFKRHVLAVNSTVVDDNEVLVNKPIGHVHGRPGYDESPPIAGVPGRGGNWHGLRSSGGL
ncbi:hypothetical protein LTR56_016364 [Elasticomyces elasticus]|nr:hypothetical protein LTR56_016364 [Elasticomyces elasticus]KAK3643682.1 hypothetical protein LTR22_015600 [Elasticomyces elasticus]KAK4915146.1 hypothetical protein LTR49_016655 [Elasticomyces elasticus]KAK5749302.1 hypothetical protein LTS12_020620 [Elasticomyces elasticus]